MANTNLATSSANDILQQLDVNWYLRSHIESLFCEQLAPEFFGTKNSVRQVKVVLALIGFIAKEIVFLGCDGLCLIYIIDDVKNDVRRICLAAAESNAHFSDKMNGATANAQRNFSVRTRWGARRCVHSDGRVVILIPSFVKACEWSLAQY